MISFTLGVGGFFTTLQGFFNSIAGSTLLEDHLLTQVSDLVLTTPQQNGDVNLNGHSITILNGSPHNGNPNVGWRIKAGNTSGCLFLVGDGGGFRNGKISFDGVFFDNNGFAIFGGQPVFQCIYFRTNMELDFRRCFFKKGPGSQAATIQGLHGGTGGFPETYGYYSKFRMFNCVMDNAINEVHDITFTQADWQIENCSSLSAMLFSDGQLSGSIRNCWSRFPNTNTGLAEAGNSNAAQTGVFLSTAYASNDFMKLNDSSPVNYGGVSPQMPGNTAGIRGNARPHHGFSSVGADEGSLVPFIVPTRAASLPAATARVSHARILRGVIGIEQFQQLHRRINAGVKI